MYKFYKELSYNPSLYEKLFRSWHFYWKQCADQGIIDKFKTFGDSLPEIDATIGSLDNSSVNENVRISKLRWIHKNDASKELFDFIEDKVDRINYHHYGFKLTGIEALQYTKYPLDGHYNFHNDIILHEKDYCRKLSIVLSLSAREDYQGGEFLLMPHGVNPSALKFDLGDLVAFPSWVPHKVSPVKQGNRITIVGWACGPKFI